VDGNPSYRKVIGELKQSGELGRRCRYRPAPYFNNIVEQDHRSIKRRVRASQGFRPLTEIGAALERSAQSHDDAAVSIELDQLKTYPSRVEAKFTSSMA
jgi:transposase-like protein